MKCGKIQNFEIFSAFKALWTVCSTMNKTMQTSHERLLDIRIDLQFGFVFSNLGTFSAPPAHPHPFLLLPEGIAEVQTLPFKGVIYRLSDILNFRILPKFSHDHQPNGRAVWRPDGNGCSWSSKQVSDCRITQSLEIGFTI